MSTPRIAARPRPLRLGSLRLETTGLAPCVLLPVLSLVLLLAGWLPAQAKTLNVPTAQYPTIQAAINAAQNGDTVLIADGTYRGPGNVDLDFGGRNDLTVQSAHGAAKTVINCGGSETANYSGDHRGFIFQNGETGAVISGLTIENGFESLNLSANYPPNGPYGGNGGGIFISNSSVSIQNCLLTQNTSGTAGGGVYCDNETSGLTITVTGCAFTRNNASFYYSVGTANLYGAGGGLYGSNAGTMTVTDCTFTGNVSDANYGNADGAGPGDGGGFYGSNSGTMTLTGCTFSQNRSLDEGGLYGTNSGTLTLTGCTFTDNPAVENGGGAGLSNSGTLNVTGCSFAGNVAGSQFGSGYGVGGGILLSSTTGTLTVTGCSFTDNTSFSGGGGAETSSRGGALTLTGCTLIRNSSGNTGPDGYGGGVENYTGPLTLTNCVLAANGANYGGGIANDSHGTLTLTNCSLTSNSAYVATGGAGGGLYNVGVANLTNDILYGDVFYDNSGNEIVSEIVNDPSAVSAATATYSDIQGGYPGVGNLDADPLFVSAVSPYDLHLQAGSPLIGKGTHTSAPATDITGRTRPDPPSIGAYEPAARALSGSGLPISAIAGKPFSGPVATFHDPGGSGFTASINWGDGTVRAGMVSGPDANGIVSVSGSHTYLHADNYGVTVTLTDHQGDTGKATTTAHVSPNPQTTPSNLTAGTSTGQVVLTWKAPTKGSGYTYDVYRGTQPSHESRTPLASGVTGTTFTDTSAVVGQRYYYFVTAVKGGVQSPQSNEAYAKLVPQGP